MTNVNKIKPNEICHSLRVMDIKKHFINRLGIFFYIYKYQIFTNQFISVINFRTFRVVFIQHSLGSTEIDKTMVRMTFKSENQEITKLSLSLQTNKVLTRTARRSNTIDFLSYVMLIFKEVITTWCTHRSKRNESIESNRKWPHRISFLEIEISISREKNKRRRR